MKVEQPRKREKDKKQKSKRRETLSSAASSVALSDKEQEQHRRRAKMIRRAEKHAQRMAALGLDANGDPLDNYSLSKYPVREWKLTLPGFQDHIALNPIVNLIGIVSVWGLVAWIAAKPTKSMEMFMSWRDQVTLQFAWLLQFTNAVGFFFLLFLAIKYGHIRLGRRDEKPEFSYMTTLAMLLAAGAGPGCLVFATAGPLSNRFGNFFAQPAYRSQDEVDLFALNVSVFEWGILMWTRYTLIGVCMALAGNRFGLPLTIRSCFFPILGHYTWGWMGDVIDGIALVAGVAGSIIIMTFTIVQIVTCMMYLGWMDSNSSEEDIKSTRNLSICVVTIMSTASVISGLRGGVRFFSRVAMMLCTLLVLLLTTLDDTKYVLNLSVQEIGYHLQTSMFQLNFWTDAFGQLRAGSGRATDGGASDPTWFNTQFAIYHSVSISVGCGIGMFYAHLVRGRNLREMIVLSLLVPMVYFVVWFSAFGGIGMRHHRQADELRTLGTTYFNNSEHFLVDGSQHCYDVPQSDVVVDDATIFTNHLPGVTPVCQFHQDGMNTIVLDMLNAFSFTESFGARGFGPVLVAGYAGACVLTLISSLDSNSLMVDALSSNARKNYHWLRRLFWAGTGGAVSITLLSVAGTRSMKGVEAFGIVCSVPMLMAICFMFQSIVLFCKAADTQGSRNGALDDYEYRFPIQPEFAMPLYGGVLNSVEYAMSLGYVNTARIELGMHCATKFHVVEFLKGLTVPFVSLNQVLSATFPHNPKTNKMTVVLYALCYFAWLGTWLASHSYPGLNGLVWTFFVVSGGIIGMVRSSFRAQHNLRSNAFADYVGSLFLWPQVLTQMRVQCVDCRKDSGMAAKGNEPEFYVGQKHDEKRGYNGSSGDYEDVAA